MSRCMEVVEGKRHERRPSAIAKKANCRYSTEVMGTDVIHLPDGTWADVERMPNEADMADVGWCPGPIQRQLPAFSGPKPGPTNPNLAADSSEVDIMRELLTDKFKRRCHELTVAHVNAFRTSHPNRGRKSVERAFGNNEDFLELTEAGCERFKQLFDTWLAAKLRVAQLKPEVPAKALWGQVPEAKNLYDHELDLMITHRQFQWCNRHMSFADALETGDASDDEDAEENAELGRDDSADESESAASAGEDEDEVHEVDSRALVISSAQRQHDTFRKRRELTDLANEEFARAFNPHQHLGLDEAARSTKHWERMRIKFKAAIHSGTLVDMLCDCRTNYAMWFQEQSWEPYAESGDEVQKVTARLRRAAQCLVAKGHTHGKSTAGYCISMDRGYGHLAAQQALWEHDWIYSNAMIMCNRKGLPREYIQQVAADLGACPSKCTHMPHENECRKFMWTVLHKPPFELCLWQDTKLILSFGNFFSGNRAGLLARGAKKRKESHNIWVPESIWHYNVEGRSATDGSDQLRKKLCVAERRVQRAGHKGICFVFDIAFTNGSLMQRFMQPTSMRRTSLDQYYTKVLFCLRWTGVVLRSYAPFRQRCTRDLRAVNLAFTPQSSSVGLLTSSSSNLSQSDRAMD